MSFQIIRFDYIYGQTGGWNIGQGNYGPPSPKEQVPVGLRIKVWGSNTWTALIASRLQVPSKLAGSGRCWFKGKGGITERERVRERNLGDTRGKFSSRNRLLHRREEDRKKEARITVSDLRICSHGRSSCVDEFYSSSLF